MKDILMFKLGSSETFAIDALEVREIVNETRLNQIPGSSEVVSGCMHFRGTTIPVLDLPKLLFSKQTDDHLVIVLDRLQYGLKVSQVTQIVKMDLKFDEQALFSRRFVDGVFIGDDGALVQMLGIDKIIRHLDNNREAA